MSDEKIELRRCPACKQPLSDTFQTKCPTCGYELTSAESAQAVKDFFARLDDLSQKEYEAAKAREEKKEKPIKSKAVFICEVLAIISFIMIILHIIDPDGNIKNLINSLIASLMGGE